jgi:hypothetical protein
MYQFPLAVLAVEDFGHADAHGYRLVAPSEVDRNDPAELATRLDGEQAFRSAMRAADHSYALVASR